METLTIIAVIGGVIIAAAIIIAWRANKPHKKPGKGTGGHIDESKKPKP